MARGPVASGDSICWYTASPVDSSIYRRIETCSIVGAMFVFRERIRHKHGVLVANEFFCGHTIVHVPPSTSTRTEDSTIYTQTDAFYPESDGL
jgi:hypothetical protein